jgi:hypothetical protein
MTKPTAHKNILDLFERYAYENDPAYTNLEEVLTIALRKKAQGNMTTADLLECFQHLRLPDDEDLPQHLQTILDNGEQKPDDRVVITNAQDIKALFQDEPVLLYHHTHFYEVIDPNHKVLRPLDKNEGQVETDFRARLMARLVNSGMAYKEQTRRSLMRAVRSYLDYEVYGRPLEQKPSLNEVGPSERWCFHRCLIEPDETRDTPEWDGFLDRLSSPELFLAWLWGVLTGEYRGRSLLYLRGKRGNEGKSTAVRVLAKHLFGNTAHAVNNRSMKGQYTTWDFAQKALLTYLDCNNPAITKSELVKSITTFGEEVPLDGKWKMPATAPLYCRMVVCSNRRPLLDDQAYDLPVFSLWR